MSKLVPSKEDILNKLLHSLVESRDLQEICRSLYDQLKIVIPLERMGIVFFSDDGKYFVSKVNISEFPIKLTNGYRAEAKSSTLKKLIEDQSVRVINDLPKYLHDKPESISSRLMVLEGIRSNMSVPLVANGKPLGILFLASVDIGAYGQGHIDIVKHITNAISITLERALLLENIGLGKTISHLNSNSPHPPISSPVPAEPEAKTWKDWESYILRQTLLKCKGKIYGENGAATILNLPPTTLQGKLKKLGLSRKEILKEFG